MARRNDVTLGIGGDLSPLIRDIERLTKKKYSLNFQTKGNLAQPLGRITGQLGEFEKSLEASNARVLAFSASAGALYAFQRGVDAIFKSAVNLEKQLADINVILNVSSKNLNKFGNELFSVAKNTAQGFDAVAEAATELARQGLSVEETLKRTNDALILTRLSGMDAVSAVESLTAALNSFSRAAMDSTTFVSKLAAVDAAFAVSSADLAEAIKRVGSSAQEAGLDIDELIAAVTAAQQITARGGAVIGNSFKTIFTRIQRPRVLKALEELGIKTTDLAGNTRPAMKVMQDLANTFDRLADSQKSTITQLVGGVFQVNVLKASLRDLNKEFSLYKNALDISSSATDEAIRRNEELNKTVSATLNRTVENLRKTAAEVGGLTLAPVTKKLASSLNKALENFNIGEGIGGKLAEGILGGLGKFFSGGGLALAGVTLFRVFQRLVVQVSDAFRTLTGIGQISQNELLLQQQISATMAGNPQIINKIKNGTLTVSQVHKTLLHQIELENKALHLQKRLAEQIAGALHKSGVTIGNTFGEMIPPGGKASVADHPLMASSRKGHVPRKSKGHIPNYNKREKAAKRQELREASYAKPSTRAVIDRMSGLGKYVRNTAEEKIPGKITGHKQDWINPPKQSSEGKTHRAKAIKQHGIDPYALKKGMVPNFAKIIDKDHLGGVQYDLVMKYALKKGHPIINVAGPGGSGKNHFAENLVSKERSRTKGQRAKGWWHRGKEAAAGVAGKMGAYGAEQKLRSHHSYGIKGGSYIKSDDRFFVGAHGKSAKTGGVGGKPVNPKTMLAKFQKGAKEDENWTPGGVGSAESLIFLHSTEGMISKRADLFRRAQSNYLIARGKEKVQELRDKRAVSGMGAMNRNTEQATNVGTRSHESLEQKMKEIGATISYVKNQGFVPNFAQGDVTVSGGFMKPPNPKKKPTITTGAGAAGRSSYGYGTYKTKVEEPAGKITDFMTMTADAVKDPTLGGFAIQPASVYATPANHPLLGQGFGTQSYLEIRDKVKSTGLKGIFSANQLNTSSNNVWQSLLSKHGAMKSGQSSPYGRYVLRNEGMVPNFIKYQIGQKLPKGRGEGGRHLAVRDQNMGIHWDPKAMFHADLVKRSGLEGKTMDGGWLFPNGRYEKIQGHDGSGLQAGGHIPNFIAPRPFGKHSAYEEELKRLRKQTVQDLVNAGHPRPHWPKGQEMFGVSEMNLVQSLYDAPISHPNNIQGQRGWKYNPTGTTYNDERAINHARSLGLSVAGGYTPNFAGIGTSNTLYGMEVPHLDGAAIKQSGGTVSKAGGLIDKGTLGSLTKNVQYGTYKKPTYGPKTKGFSPGTGYGIYRMDRDPIEQSIQGRLAKGIVPNFKELFSRVGSDFVYEDVRDSFLPAQGHQPGLARNRPSGVMLDYFNMPNKNWHKGKGLHVDDIADTHYGWPWATKQKGDLRNDGSRSKSSSWLLNDHAQQYFARRTLGVGGAGASTYSGVAGTAGAFKADKKDYLELFFGKMTHRTAKMPTDPNPKGQKLGKAKRAGSLSPADAAKMAQLPPSMANTMIGSFSGGQEDIEHLKPGGMLLRGKSGGGIPNFEKWTSGQDLPRASVAFNTSKGVYYDPRAGTSMHFQAADYLKKRKEPYKGKHGFVTKGPGSKYEDGSGEEKPESELSQPEGNFWNAVGDDPMGGGFGFGKGSIPNFMLAQVHWASFLSQGSQSVMKKHGQSSSKAWDQERVS